MNLIIGPKVGETYDEFSQRMKMKYFVHADECDGTEFDDMQNCFEDCDEDLIKFIGIEITDESITATTKQIHALLAFGHWIDFSAERAYEDDSDDRVEKFDPFIAWGFKDDDVEFHSSYFYQFATILWGDDFNAPSNKYLVNNDRS